MSKSIDENLNKIVQNGKVIQDTKTENNKIDGEFTIVWSESSCSRQVKIYNWISLRYAKSLFNFNYQKIYL